MAIGGGTAAEIFAMRDSEMTPGPLGISDTKPSADAPRRTASRPSSIDVMQQILTRVVTGAL